MKCKRNEKIENEELLGSFPQILDSFGWFQVRSFILLSFPIASIGMFSMSPVFFNIVPPYRCQWSHDNQVRLFLRHSFLSFSKSHIYQLLVLKTFQKFARIFVSVLLKQKPNFLLHLFCLQYFAMSSKCPFCNFALGQHNLLGGAFQVAASRWQHCVR